jgi:hypothetical protein
MKSRKTVLLMLLVIAVWGTIGYKVYQGLEDNDSQPGPPVRRKVALV